MLSRSRHTRAAVIFICGACAFLLLLGRQDVSITHEARVAQTAREMAASGWPWRTAPHRPPRGAGRGAAVGVELLRRLGVPQDHGGPLPRVLYAGVRVGVGAGVGVAPVRRLAGAVLPRARAGPAGEGAGGAGARRPRRGRIPGVLPPPGAAAPARPYDRGPPAAGDRAALAAGGVAGRAGPPGAGGLRIGRGAWGEPG